MILLDTNVISEPLKAVPDSRLIRWLDEQVPDTLYTSSINYAEIFAGVECLPDGNRKRKLALGLQKLLANLFGPRILSFDTEAALVYAQIEAHTRKIGKPISAGDQQIAAIAKVHGFAVATRDIGPFYAADVKVIDPWKPN